MKLRRPAATELESIYAWTSDRAILGPYQRPFGWTAQSPIKGLDLLLVIVEERPAGFAYIHRTRLGIAEIGVTLLPDFRGRGIGRQVHEELIETLRPESECCVQALVASENIAEIRILRRLGFACVDRLPTLKTNEAGATVLVFRRTLRPEDSIDASLAVFITGAPGSGKSTICELLKPILARKHPDKTVKFIWGDMLAHLSFPWRANPEQLALKYDAMQQLLNVLLKPDVIILVDDILRREEDVDVLRNFVLLRQSRPLFVRLETSLETALERNRTRYEREMLPNKKVKALFKAASAAVRSGPDVIVVENEGAKANTARAISRSIAKHLTAR